MVRSIKPASLVTQAHDPAVDLAVEPATEPAIEGV
jgi:hypothetical protein